MWGTQVCVKSKDRKARTVFQNLLNVGKTVLKLEEIMWKSDYVQLKIKVEGIYFFLN